MLPPAIALAVQNEFKTRFDGSEMQVSSDPTPPGLNPNPSPSPDLNPSPSPRLRPAQTEGEITRFAKSIASDFEHDAPRERPALRGHRRRAPRRPPAARLKHQKSPRCARARQRQPDLALTLARTRTRSLTLAYSLP